MADIGVVVKKARKLKLGGAKYRKVVGAELAKQASELKDAADEATSTNQFVNNIRNLSFRWRRSKCAARTQRALPTPFWYPDRPTANHMPHP